MKIEVEVDVAPANRHGLTGEDIRDTGELVGTLIVTLGEITTVLHPAYGRFVGWPARWRREDGEVREDDAK